MTRLVQTSRTRRPYGFLVYFLALVVLAAGLATRNRAADDPARKRPAVRSQQALERFRKMSPEDRLTQVEKVAGAKAFVAVMCADLDLAIVERGTVDSAEVSDIVCRVKARVKGSPVAGTIKWVIDDGTRVKKGDRLIEVDDSALQEHLRAQKLALEKATAHKVLAETNLKLVRAHNRLELLKAEINLKQARRQLKKYTGTDEDDKESLKEQIELAELGVEAIKLTSKVKEGQADIEVKAKTAIVGEHARQRQVLEAEIAACVIRSPQDGVAVYYIPEVARRAAPGAEQTVAQGESVHEGQKLVRVCGLERFIITTRVHEALISRVRAGQATSVLIDAFPKQQLRGRVKAVATVASQQDWLRADVKVYPVVVDITDKLPRLKPGMSGEVRIEGERRARVLQVPVESVLRIRRESFCYVKVGKGLQERKVTTGRETNIELNRSAVEEQCDHLG